MYGESNSTAAVDPYSDAYNAVPAPAPSDRDAPPARGRSRSRSPARSVNGANGADRERDRDRDRGERYKSPPPRRRSPASRRPPPNAPVAPNPSSVLGVFGLSIRTRERDLDDEFSRFGRVEKVTIVYDQRSDRSRGFGFIQMSTVDEAARCIKELNGVELNGRRIRVDYSVTDRPHAPTPGEYMGHRRNRDRDSYRDRYDRDSYRDSHRDRDYRRSSDRDRDRDHYGRDRSDRDRDWRDRRSPAPRSRYSPDREYKRRRSPSRSPPPRSPAREYDAAPASAANGDAARW